MYLLIIIVNDWLFISHCVKIHIIFPEFLKIMQFKWIRYMQHLTANCRDQHFPKCFILKSTKRIKESELFTSSQFPPIIPCACVTDKEAVSVFVCTYFIQCVCKWECVFWRLEGHVGLATPNLPLHRASEDEE